eukprot:12250175-Prorocentrum_lima.AAC.1
MLSEACAQTDRNHVPGLVAHGSQQQHLENIRREIEINRRTPMCDICRRRQRSKRFLLLVEKCESSHLRILDRVGYHEMSTISLDT